MKKQHTTTLTHAARHIALCTMAMIATTAAHAQLDNVVEVENDFKPTVHDATKINSLPEIEQVNVAHYNVDYTTTSFPTTDYAFQPMWAAHNDALLKPRKKGFVTAAYGMQTNMMGRAQYTFDLAPHDQLTFDLSGRGYKSKVDHVDGVSPQWESRIFNTDFAATYCHWLSATSQFTVKAQYGTDLFNYQHLVAAPAITDKQHNDRLDLGLTLTPYSFGRFNLGADALLQTFKQKYATTFDKGNSEFMVNGALTPGYTFNENLSADVRLAAEYVDYSMDPLPGTDHAVKGFTSFDVTPHIYYQNELLSIKAGVFVDNDVNIAPDVNITFHLTPTFDIYLMANGGDINNDFRHFSSMTPYWQLADHSFEMANQYDQIRSRGGVRVKPARFLTLDLSAGYDMSEDRAELADFLLTGTTELLRMPVVFADGKHFYANADIRLDYKNIVTADLNTQYNHWTTDMKLAGVNTDPLWRPEFEADWKLAITPIKGFTIGADLLFESFKKADGRYRRDNTIDLGATIGYTLPIGLSIYAKGDNLLNKKYDHYSMYRTPGTNFLAGLAFTF